MGALHDGHAALIERARSQNTLVLVSVFVNPLQFGEASDLQRYPRDLASDVTRCAAAGADLVWAPEVTDVFPAGTPQVTVDPGPAAAQLEGAARPGHFAGALTMVAKLLGAIRPDRAYFGEKDYQQLELVRRMVTDLDLAGQVVAVPTVREPDGLARSSRNVFLTPADRRAALALPRALTAAAAAATSTAGDAQAVLDAARRELAELSLDYLALRAPDLGPAPAAGPARLLVAAKIGTVRLIDNVAVELATRAGRGRS